MEATIDFMDPLICSLKITWHPWLKTQTSQGIGCSIFKQNAIHSLRICYSTFSRIQGLRGSMKSTRGIYKGMHEIHKEIYEIYIGLQGDYKGNV